MIDYLHWSKSILSGGSIERKIYFSKNLIPDLLEDGVEYFMRAVEAYNKLVKKNKTLATVINENEVFGKAGASIQFSIELIQKTNNQTVNDLFLAVCEGSQITSDFIDLFIWWIKDKNESWY